MMWKETTLTGWGRVRSAATIACRPERMAELDQALRVTQSEPGGLIAYGAGRSYGDAPLNSGGRTILTRRLDRLVEFDPATNLLVAEPGVTFADLMSIFLPQGRMAPASPGTAFATLGGAVANDVHGKNHDRHGSFGDHVAWIELLCADGEVRRVSPDDDPDLFAATIGGIGLTGIMRKIAVHLLPGATSAVEVRERRVADLEAFLDAMFEVRDKSTFAVGWIDALARGRGLGRGILETAEFTQARVPPLRRAPRAVPFDLPEFALSPAVVRTFNTLYYSRIPPEGRTRIRPLAHFLYPLDAIHDWHRIYGRRGFYQFQCVVPDAEAPRALGRLLEDIGASSRGSFLAVLKTLGGPGRGFLSFPMRGVTLALDFPRVAGIEDQISRLTRLVREHGGRIYLAKDALLGSEDFRAMYPGVERFEHVRARIDPGARFVSDMARRLGLRTTALGATA